MFLFTSGRHVFKKSQSHDVVEVEKEEPDDSLEAEGVKQVMSEVENKPKEEFRNRLEGKVETETKSEVEERIRQKMREKKKRKKKDGSKRFRIRDRE